MIVWDGHDGSQTLSVSTIEPRAKLIMGGLSSTMLMERQICGDRIHRSACAGEFSARGYGA